MNAVLRKTIIPSHRTCLVQSPRVVDGEAGQSSTDAQAIERFINHEVKNALLASIELCDNLRSTFAKTMIEQIERNEAKIQCVNRMDELSRLLKGALNCLTSKSMARDVINGTYALKLETSNIAEIVRSVGQGIMQPERLSIEFPEGPVPDVLVDNNLLRHMLLNALSNACKYGKTGGTIATQIHYDESSNELRIDVVNEPGRNHQHLKAMGSQARRAVFAPGSILHSDLEEPEIRAISSGDGAWVIARCAKTMGGTCDIVFEENKTIFSLQCPAKTSTTSCKLPEKPFQLPPDTWVIAIDDCRIQRRLLSRMFVDAGVDASKCKVIGEDYSQVRMFGQLLSDLVKDKPNDRFLVITDESLEYQDENGKPVSISGSSTLGTILQKLDKDDKCRVLALVRSGYDSPDDIALFKNRVDGFFPKSVLQAQEVGKIISSVWQEKFR